MLAAINTSDVASLMCRRCQRTRAPRRSSVLRTPRSRTWMASTTTAWRRASASGRWTTCRAERKPSRHSLCSLPFTGICTDTDDHLITAFFFCHHQRPLGTKVKVKVRFLYSATYMVDHEQRASQSQKWPLIGKSQWCCGANAAIRCPRYWTLDPW